MDKATVIALAREAGAEFAELPMTDAIVFSVEDRAWNSAALQRFAALVAAHERAICAQIAKQWDADHPSTNYGGCIAAAIRSRT